MDLQRRQMRSPAHALGNGVLQIRHRRVFASGLGSASRFLYVCFFMRCGNADQYQLLAARWRERLTICEMPWLVFQVRGSRAARKIRTAAHKVTRTKRGAVPFDTLPRDPP